MVLRLSPSFREFLQLGVLYRKRSFTKKSAKRSQQFCGLDWRSKFSFVTIWYNLNFSGWNSQWFNGSTVYCFIWLSQQAEALQEAITQSKTNY